MPAKLTRLTATELLAKIRAREVTALEALEAHNVQVKEVNPAINALVEFQWGVARDRAKALDAMAAHGEWAGPLHGLPMSVKEGFDVFDLHTTVGDPRLKNNVAKANATAVQRLVDAGAVVFAKSNVPLYMSDLQAFNAVYGSTKNPWDVTRTSGGSSGGAAAALASGMTPLELGSDLAGSIRTPAHFCGVYGHRSTFDLVPVQGHFIGGRTRTGLEFTVAGPMARCVEDLKLGLSVLAGPVTWTGTSLPLQLPPAPQKPLAEWRVGVWFDDAAAPLDGAMQSVLASAVAKLKLAGCQIVQGPPAGLSLAEIYPLYFKLMAASVGGGVPEKVYAQAEKGARLSRFLGSSINSLLGYAKSMTMSHREWCGLQEELGHMRAKMAQAFKAADVWLMPCTQTSAPPHTTHKIEFYKRQIVVNGKNQPYADQMKWPAPAALLGLPATAVPVGFTDAKLPVGLQVVGPEYGDLTTLAFAQLMEPVTGGFVAPPQF